MKNQIPILFITHGNKDTRFRTEYAVKCLNSIIANIKNPRLYICNDRSDEYHTSKLMDVLTDNQFKDFTFINSTKDHFGYGYVTNQGAKKAFNDGYEAVMLMEDDWLLLQKYDFIPLFQFLNSNAEYGMIKLFKKTHDTKKIPGVNFVEECSLERDSENICTCNLQCSIRHKRFYEQNWLPENCSAANVELDSCKLYNEIRKKHPQTTLKLLWFTNGHNVLQHIGERTNPNNIYVKKTENVYFPKAKSLNEGRKLRAKRFRFG